MLNEAIKNKKTLSLKLRDEFLGSQTPGTAISLRKSDNTGAADRDSSYILSITYPTTDVVKALRAISNNRLKRPIVLLGERGSGKSHIMAVMHHAIKSPEKVEIWAKEWNVKLSSQIFSGFTIERAFEAISEPLQNHEYKLLWELLFDRHPKGEFYKGKFSDMGQRCPPRSLLEDMFKEKPVALILDEFQIWFDGLSDNPGVEGIKYKTLAENFIQNLSELSVERPDILILAISVKNNNTEVFRQVHRDTPVIIDFKGDSTKEERKKLLIHRLFENRENFSYDEIENSIKAYRSERWRLRFPNTPETKKEQIFSEVTGCWPFSPELLELLEEHILMAQNAQETRDLIRILASIFKERGDKVPLITPADFFVDNDACGVQSLLDSIADDGQLRQIAQKNLETIKEANNKFLYAQEIVSSIWMRSMSPGRNAGGTKQEIHLDITREQPIDDNLFLGEFTSIIEASFNIHEEEPGGRFTFMLKENPRSKVRAFAKNDKNWQSGMSVAETDQTYSGKDIEHIRDTINHIFNPADTREQASRVIVLGQNWINNPWIDVKEGDKPSQWSRPVLIIVPEPIQPNKRDHIEILGKWLKNQVSENRNAIRFLFTADSGKGIYFDSELLFLARCSYLTSSAWQKDPIYYVLKSEFDKPFRDVLKKRFNKFAILKHWNFQNPEDCVFYIERIEPDKENKPLPDMIEETIKKTLFIPEEFHSLVDDMARDSCLVDDLIDAIIEPPPTNTQDVIPFLGDKVIYEEVLNLVARGKIVVNVSGTWIRPLPEHSNDQEALTYVRSKAYRSGQEMRKIQLALPESVGGTNVIPSHSSIVPLQVTSQGAPQQPLELSITHLLTDSRLTISEPVDINLAEEDNTGINLAGCFEKWNIDANTTLNSVKIGFNNIPVQQIKQILACIPLNFKASLDVSFTKKDIEK